MIFLVGIILLFIGLDFTFWGHFFLPEYGSEVGIFRGIFSLISLLGGGFLSVRGGWLLTGPLLLEVNADQLKLYNAWGRDPLCFPMPALDLIEVIRFVDKGGGRKGHTGKEKWISFRFNPTNDIPTHVPFYFGIQYERYTLRIATNIMQKKAAELAAFLSTVPGPALKFIDKE
jgi:hypothetical protein